MIRFHLFGVRFSRVLSRDFWCKQTANVRTFGSQTTTRLQMTSRYFKFPLLYNSKCQSRRIRATSTPWIWLSYAGTSSFRKRIFENFANGNRLCSRKNGFAGGSKLRKRWNQWCREFNNSWQANSQSIFSEDREQLQLVAAVWVVWFNTTAALITTSMGSPVTSHLKVTAYSVMVM